ncbi:hypothetical protein Dsin_003808 [Dipteronia sinensis]|uniref:Pentatricopeptide repeat-containing protein n=1 Tax=Dipteronia sinensis TaxID=43782 RepID=A0AAE0B9U3_9ROSI|nr:hypothetical protein Dsin_003808 [Dipteronia sinensis]
MVKLAASCLSVSLHYFSKFSTNMNIFKGIQQCPLRPSCFISQERRICSVQFRTYSHLDSLVSALITAITSCSSVSCCRAIQARVIKSVNYREGFIGDQLVSSYMKLGCEEDAEKLFDEVSDKDLVSWNSLISGFSRIGKLNKCLDAFSRMRFELGMQPNDVTVISIISACTDSRALDGGKYIHGIVLKLGMLFEVKVSNALINLYGKCGCLGSACRFFEAMSLQDLVSWNSIIVIHTQNGFAKEGMRLFNLMRRAEIKPDQATIVTVLQACEDLGVGKLAETIHGLILKCGLFANVVIVTVLLRLYAKLGRLFDSHKVFEEIINPDRVAWTAMLAGYAMHGRGREAIELFESMVKAGEVPDQVTFTNLLSSCGHSGLVSEGKNYFNIMSEIYGLAPRLDHYSCMVDLLGRSGHLNDAYEMIKRMPMEPNSGVWGALLCACRVYGNTELGKEVAERLIDLEPLDSRNYIMLSNIYSAAGMWKEALKVRTLMKERNLIRTPGCSFIEHRNEIHGFVAGDQSPPESKMIYKKLELARTDWENSSSWFCS